ncbi:MAG: DUF1592 domain-containing protein, partial [Proteobacteria bacterium]
AGGTLDDRVAARLASLLWLSVPDARLREYALGRKLTDPSVVASEVKRMLEDPKGLRFIDSFGKDWLSLNQLDQIASTGVLTPELKSRMKEETVRFLREVLLKRPLKELLTANYSFMNRQLASHYGVSGPSGDDFVRTDLPSSSYRRGILSHASILTITFKGNSETRPVHRGNYLLNRFLCDGPKGMIPANTTPDESQIPANATFKEILAFHSKNPTCAGCHQTLDPAGLAFDHFDGIGKYRTVYPARYRGVMVDTSESLYDQSFRSSFDLMDILGQQDKFYDCVSGYAYAYLMRAPESTDDKCAVKKISTQVKNQNQGFADIVGQMVANEFFLTESK